MTLQEAIQLADQGNVAAMMVVGQTFIDNNNIVDAVKYIEMAAEAGSSDVSNKAMLMAMPLRSILASAALDLQDYADVTAHCEKMFYWARWCLNISETDSADMFTEKDYDMAYKYGLEALYIGATAYFYQKRFQDAVEAAQGLDNYKIRLIHACSLFQIANTEQEIRTVFDELRVIESPSFYSEGEFSGKYDDTLVSMSAKTLALLYRERIGGKADINRAYDVMKTVCNLVQTANIKQGILDEMGHYKHSAFGGYQYV